jgi:GNAT superfamily N-acetyltransferase
MPGDVQIKQFELAERDALLSFLRRAYPDEPRKSDTAYWQWHYLETPGTTLDNIPLWVVRSGDEIVGQAATIPVTLKVGDESARALWILDFIVDPNYRGKGLGKRLVLAALDSYPTMMTLGFNEQSAAVFRSLQWTAVGGVNRYHKLLYPADAFREISRLGLVREIVNLAYAPFRPRLSQLSSSGIYTIREVAEFDAAFDALWDEASVQWPCAVERSARFLNWQFRRQTGKKFETLGCYDGERLRGYAVLFFRKAERGGVSSKVAISDLCYSPHSAEAVIDALLQAALRLAMERRAGSIVTDVLDSRIEERLKHYGFWRIKKSPQLMIKTNAQQHELLANAGNWFLTRADSDVSIFEQANL